MWQVLLVAAVAGSTGFVAKHFLSPSNTDPSVVPQETKQCNLNNDDPGNPIHNANLEDVTSQPLVLSNGFHKSGLQSISETQDGIFMFSSAESLRYDGFRPRTKNLRKKPVIGRRGSKNGIRVSNFEQGSDIEGRSEQNKGGRRLPFFLKRRKTTRSPTGKVGFRSSNDSSLFGWGLSYGIMYMMSAGKAEISELNKAMDETTKVVQELKSDLHRRKSTRAQQILDSVNNIDMNSRKMSGKHDEVMLEKTHSQVRDTDVNVLILPVSDDGECGSSALTEEPEGRVLEMDRLEAELEFELQKLPGCTIDSPCHEEMRPKLHELQVPDERCHGTDYQNFNFSQSHGVLPSELNQKLNHLLIEQQENQISELESELHLAQSKLHEKEAELQALKDCVRRLTELSLSTVSDDETVSRNDQMGVCDCDFNNMD